MWKKLLSSGNDEEPHLRTHSDSNDRMATLEADNQTKLERSKAISQKQGPLLQQIRVKADVCRTGLLIMKYYAHNEFHLRESRDW